MSLSPCQLHPRQTCQFVCVCCEVEVCTSCLLLGPHRDPVTFQPHASHAVRLEDNRDGQQTVPVFAHEDPFRGTRKRAADVTYRSVWPDSSACIPHVSVAWEHRSHIPKIVHFVWLNPQNELAMRPPKPDEYVALERGWQLHNPDFKVWRWDGSACRELVRQHVPHMLSAYDGYSHWVCRVDMVRWVILFVYGGVYVDADFLALRPIPEYLLHHELVVLQDRSGSIQNCFALARAGYRAFSAIANEFLACYSADADIDVLGTTGPHMLARIGLGAFPGVYVECDESIFLGLHWTDFKHDGTDGIVTKIFEGSLFVWWCCSLSFAFDADQFTFFFRWPPIHVCFRSGPRPHTTAGYLCNCARRLRLIESCS
jgi:hypothetical protein